jgi:hypothetical protein
VPKKKTEQKRLTFDPARPDEGDTKFLAELMGLRTHLLYLKSKLAFLDGEAAAACIECSRILCKVMVERGIPQRTIDTVTNDLIKKERMGS